ncbi:MAG: hypothetical protein M3O15_02370 [Acidobacteriota bacterium]|nr:hypothetical protein [Acidobacteriota bacterium]
MPEAARLTAQLANERTFSEPLVPIGEPGTEETRRLAGALEAYRSSKDIEAVQPLTSFLSAYPASVWKPSLLANLAVLYRHTGYINRALTAAGEAWRMARQSSQASAKQIADTALATYLELTAALGRTEELAALLDEVKSRPVGGHTGEVVSSARYGLWLMRHDPGGSFRCGPLAIERVSQALHPGRSLDPRLLRYPSTGQGTSLSEIARLAYDTGLELRPVKRGQGSRIPVPAVVHWKAEHFAALVEERGDRFLARDLTFGATVSFIRQYPDGSQDVYGQSDGATTMRKYFLTSVSDPAGNTVRLTWDPATSRLTSIDDALGQRTTLMYGLSGDIYKITAVTDPFGRQALFQYAAGELQSVTDAVGMSSSFTYGPATFDPSLAADFLSSMTTPYGTTTFDMGEHPPANPGDIGNVRWLLATDPLGNRERIEFIHEAAGIPDTTSEVVPAGAQNQFLKYRNTFYWNQAAMQHYSDSDPNRYLNATYLFHWLHDATGGPNNLAASSIPESVQAQGQHRIWFFYSGQASSSFQGSLSVPAATAQVLDTGQEQRSVRSYDASGRLQRMTDPLGRTYSFQYAANGIDLASVRNDLLNGGKGELMVALSYNSIHRPLAMTDYGGQMWSATYNGFGQTTSLSRPDGATTNLTYDAQGFLTKVARAGTSFQETYAYDVANRVRTWTATDGYLLTFDYDSLDRLTKITYPDGTTEAVVFDRLDVAEFHDRMGRVARYQFDPARRLVAATDPANRTSTSSWCSCGAISQLTDPLGHQTTWQRDGLNRVIGKQIDGRTTVLYDYDGSGRLVRRTDALNQATLYSYYADDALAAVSYQNAVHPTPSVFYQWDLFYPRLALMTDGFGTTSYSYYPAGVVGAGRLARIAAPAPDHALTFQYDVVGRRISSAIDGVASARAFDAQDRVVSLVNPLGTFLASYDGSSGRLSGLTYPNGQGPTFSYLDAAHDFRLSRLRYGPPAANFNLSQFDYAYDDAHEQIFGLVWHDEGNQAGRFFSFSYDAARQLTGRQQTTDPSLPGTPAVLHTTGFGYDQAGTWSVSGPAAGSIGTGGLFTAPLVPGVYIVTATSQADPTKSGAATVTVGEDLMVLPSSAALSSGGSQPFQVQVSGVLNPAVTWSVEEGAAGGTISSAGVYTAPAAAGVYHLLAVSSASGQVVQGIATVVVGASGSRPTISVTVSPSEIQLSRGAALPFTAAVAGSADAGIVWSASAGIIDQNGLFTAPAGFGTVTVTATSHADSRVQASATVVVSDATRAQPYQYDANGNLLSDGTRTYEWDAENRLTAITIGAHRSEFGYDGLGRRVLITEKDNGAATTRRHDVWVGDQIAEETDASVLAATSPASGGSFDGIDCNQLAGWAWDSTQPNTPISVDLYDGSAKIATALANAYRVDLKSAGVGNGGHGFFVATPAALKTGAQHQVSINLAGTETVLGTRSLTCAVPSFGGSLDGADCNRLAGWAWDSAQPSSPITVDIYDGTTLIATVLANAFRQDLLSAGLGNGRHAFFFPTPASLKTGAAHSVTFRVGGAANVLGGATITCSAPSFNGYLDAADCGQLSGWAWDARQPNAPINVDIYEGPVLLATVPAGNFRQDLQSAGLGNGNHGFTYTSPALYSGSTHSLTVNISGTSLAVGASPRTVTCPFEPILTRFFPGGMQSGGANYYFSYDHLGSIREVTDGSGNVVSRYDYDSYGRLTVNQGTPPRFGFAGYFYHAPSGLSLTKYRAYDPDLGRWESRDPLGEPAGNNPYSYVDDDPVNFLDPAGLIKLPPDPSSLPSDWLLDPSHMPKNGERYRNPKGDLLDFDRAQPGMPGWRGRDHWHYYPGGMDNFNDPDGRYGKTHLPPGTDVPEIPDKGGSKRQCLPRQTEATPRPLSVVPIPVGMPTPIGMPLGEPIGIPLGDLVPILW